MNFLLSLALGFQVAAPPEPANIQAAAEYAFAQASQAVLVMQDGETIYEEYAAGGGPDRLQSLASGSKSFVGLVALCAVEDGLIDLDEPLSNEIAEWKGLPTKGEVTVRQMLSLVGGVSPGSPRDNFQTRTWQDALEAPARFKPGEQFAYGPFPFFSFGEFMNRRLETEEFEAYLNRRLLEPLGIEVRWGHGPDGNPNLPGGGRTTARDWAVFGEFVRNRGMHQGERLLGEALFAELEKNTSANPTYGLTWWLNEPRPERGAGRLVEEMSPMSENPSIPEDLFFAAGAGKQRLYIVRSRGLVIVRLGPIRSAGFSDEEFLGRLFGGAPN